MKHSTTGEMTFVAEEFEVDLGDGEEVMLDVTLRVEYTLEPYDPGCRYTSNGDGWPPSGGGVEDLSAFVESVRKSGESEDFTPTADQLLAVQTCVNAQVEDHSRLRERIEEKAIERASEPYDCDDRW